MSRYSLMYKDWTTGKTYNFVYGFDKPMAQYFAQVWLEDSLSDHDECVIDVDGRGNVLELMEECGVVDEVNPNHIEALVLDLPF